MINITVLITGGTGYIGSHTAVELISKGREVVIVDDLSNSNIIVLDRIKEITGVMPKFYNMKVQDRNELEKVFKENNINSVIHFAALKSVGESVDKPLEYYSNNLINTIVLLETMKKYRVNNFVFSSSATVYGDNVSPMIEDYSLSVTNPYGRTKLMIEDMLRDICNSDDSLNVAILRYFNPVGAHKSGRIGEEPNGIPNNLMPYITKVAMGHLEELKVFGNDYETVDGTGVRDYIHVVDLAKGHIAALSKIEQNSGLVTYNLGTGRGYSVLEMVKAFSKASNRNINYKIVDRRQGDIGMCYADVSKVSKELNWKAEYDINDMCEDSWRWQVCNPNGYEN